MLIMLQAERAQLVAAKEARRLAQANKEKERSAAKELSKSTNASSTAPVRPHPVMKTIIPNVPASALSSSSTTGGTVPPAPVKKASPVGKASLQAGLQRPMLPHPHHIQQQQHRGSTIIPDRKTVTAAAGTVASIASRSSTTTTTLAANTDKVTVTLSQDTRADDIELPDIDSE